MAAAFQVPGLCFTLEAGEDIPRYRFVSVYQNVDPDLPPTAGLTSSSGVTVCVGASTQPAKTGEPVEIADGIVMVEAEGNVPAGSPVKSGAEGRAALSMSGTDVIFGIALTNAQNGELVTVKIIPTW